MSATVISKYFHFMHISEEACGSFACFVKYDDSETAHRIEALENPIDMSVLSQDDKQMIHEFIWGNSEDLDESDANGIKLRMLDGRCVSSRMEFANDICGRAINIVKFIIDNGV